MRTAEDRVATPDGGRLALYTYGAASAPGERRLVVVGGAFITALIYRPFAEALARRLGPGWSVDVYDRRGRGSSSEHPEDYSMDTEIADLAAVLRATGARNVFGHSLGGAVALNAVQAYAGGDAGHRRFADPALVPRRLAVYDAAISIHGRTDTDWLEGFTAAAESGRFGLAVARLQRGMRSAPGLSRLPEPLLALLATATSRTPAGRLLRALMPTGVGELTAALRESEAAGAFAYLPRGTRFMAGTRSPEYFRATALALHRAVAGSSYRESPRGFHGSVSAAVDDLIDDVARYFATGR